MTFAVSSVFLELEVLPELKINRSELTTTSYFWSSWSCACEFINILSMEAANCGLKIYLKQHTSQRWRLVLELKVWLERG